MHWLEHKYISLVSARLRNYKRKSSGLYNFSCPICGDSATNQRKARGYVYDSKGKMLYHCHNCGVTTDVPKLIKILDQNLYNEMMMEKLKNEKTPEQEEFDSFVEKMKKPVFMKAGQIGRAHV